MSAAARAEARKPFTLQNCPITVKTGENQRHTTNYIGFTSIQRVMSKKKNRETKLVARVQGTNRRRVDERPKTGIDVVKLSPGQNSWAMLPEHPPKNQKNQTTSPIIHFPRLPPVSPRPPDTRHPD